MKNRDGFRDMPRQAERMDKRRSSIQASLRGFSIVELMVAVVIGMVVVLVMMQVFAQTRQWNNNAASSADANTSGQLAAYAVSRSLATAGGTLDAVRCRHKDTGSDSDRVWIQGGINSTTESFFLPLLPVVITSNGDGGDAIEVVAQSGVAGNGGLPLWEKASQDTDPLVVRSFQGVERGGRMLISKEGSATTSFIDDSITYHCVLAAVSDIKPDDRGAGQAAYKAFYKITHPAGLPNGFYPVGIDAVLPTGTAVGTPSSNWVQGTGTLNIHHLSVRNDLANGGSALVREVRPLGNKYQSGDANSSNIENPDVVYLKAFYGFDNEVTPGGAVTVWLPADSCSMGTSASGWECATILSNDKARTAERLLAIRFGLVVKVAQHEKDRVAVADTANDQYVTMWDWAEVCNSGAVCPSGKVQYTIPVTSGDDQREFRYRSFQAVVPLRSSIWNVIKPS